MTPDRSFFFRGGGHPHTGFGFEIKIIPTMFYTFLHDNNNIIIIVGTPILSLYANKLFSVISRTVEILFWEAADSSYTERCATNTIFKRSFYSNGSGETCTMVFKDKAEGGKRGHFL